MLYDKIIGGSKLNITLKGRQSATTKVLVPSSQTSRSSENYCFPYVFYWLVVSCRLRSIFFVKFVWHTWIYLYYKYIDTPCLRASPFLVYHTIETHITSICKIDMKITFQTIKWNLHSLCVIFLLTSITCYIDIILFCTDVMRL
jgi:hypothetical protein